MASTRTYSIAGVFAGTATTTIPASPVTGVTYRDATIAEIDYQNGWSFNEIVDSTVFNQILYSHGSVLKELDQQGVLGWSDAVDYGVSALVRGSDDKIYISLLASGPATAIKDPISEPATWQNTGLDTGGFALLNSSNIFTASQTINTELTVDGGAGGAIFNVKTDKTSSTLGFIDFTGKNTTAGATIDYARILTTINTGVDGLEDARVGISTMNAGSLVEELRIDGGVYAPLATGGAKGVGTGNFTALYENGVGVPKLATPQEWTKTQNFNATVLIDIATIAWNAQDNQVASVTLAGNRTLGAPTNLVDGATYILTVKQDATGTRTLAYNAVFKFSGGTAPSLTTTANAVDVLTFISDGTNMYGVFQGDFS